LKLFVVCFALGRARAGRPPTRSSQNSYNYEVRTKTFLKLSIHRIQFLQETIKFKSKVCTFNLPLT